MECCNALAAAIPGKGRMRLQKCNIKVWNALAKVQSQHSELTTYPREGTIAREERRSLPERASEKLQKALVEGECEIWDSLCPGFAPNPFLCFFWFWGFSLVCFLVGRSSSSLEALLASVAASTCNECVTRYGGEARDTPPPLRTITTIVFKLPRILGVGRCPAALPTQCAAEPSTPPHFCPAAVKITARMTEVGEQPYCHTNAVDDRSSSNPVLLFGALRPYLLAKQSRFPQPLHAPYPVDPEGIQGRGEKESGAAPHSLDKCPEEGLRAPQRL